MEKKMKPLKPSMREKKRYLKVEGKNLKVNIEKSILEFVGVLGLSKAGLKIVKSRGDSEGSAIIAVNREAVDSVRASFAVFPEKIEVTRVSGSLGNFKDLK